MFVVCDFELRRVHEGVVGSEEGESHSEEECEANGGSQTCEYGFLCELSWS